ncbi:putative invertase inhibitor [Cucumis melo var. makuwa]|uniref:Invertase inhibitor n=2 Tax=Cucumis melo TaxID=3656 RepID=A0A5A7U1K7_CUCMM|nr:putative invertase inhibitor [Cucumis melo]KAA0049108.1 putative invertase inhibitor [Cucumis melo var. makuwa]TYK17455.1 putative invertase inhibitor [Cucumis melo var. makuwa]
MSFTYTHRCIALAFSFVVLLNFEPISANDIVSRTCETSAARDPNVRLDFCLRSLAAAPGSDTADLYELGAISIRLIGRNATSTQRYIERLLKNEKKKSSSDSYIRPRLSDCEELYSDAVETVGEAAAEYGRKRYDEVNVKLSSVMDAVTTCEDGFKEMESRVSPLTKRNGDVFELAAIALCILDLRP